MRLFSWVLLSITLVGSFAGANEKKEPAARPGEIILKLDANSTASDVLKGLRSTLGEKAIESIRPFMTDPSVFWLRLSSRESTRDVIHVLREQEGVRLAEPNYIYHATIQPAVPLRDEPLPNDPDFAKSWNLLNVGQADAKGQVGIAGADINVFPLWQKGIRGSSKILVAVIDTGIDWTHPDLKANLYTNPGEAGDLATNGKDDDGNGFVDDVHGFNFDKHTGNSNDDNDHGSHCAGVIGAEGNNQLGTSGINWQISLLPVKFLDANGYGTLEGAVEAVNYARLMKVRAMSNSWGGTGASQVLLEAVQQAKDAGILFIAAAGNDSNNNDANPFYPAGFQVDNVISVAATDNRDQLASFSNFGRRTVHVAAPGVNIYSTVKGGKYDTFSGTSMATPHVSGLAALLLSQYPEWDFATLKERIMKTSRIVPGLRRKSASSGRIDALRAFNNEITPIQGDPDEALWKDVAQKINSAHPYSDNQNLVFNIHVPGAKYLRIHFEKVDVEAGYDVVSVESPQGEVIDKFSGKSENVTSDYVEGDTAIVRLKTDSSIGGYGFDVDRVQMIP